LEFGPQVEPESVATDSFMVNLQSVMLRFAEPFMDARYSKASLPPLTTDRILTFKVQIDRIDPLYFARSSRIDVKEETRIKATSDEASAWVKENESPNGSFQFIFMSLKKH
jgi:ubiquitin conjugation factor E4 B